MLKLRPYQDEAADFLYARDHAMLLAPVGAGKTATALTVMRDMLANLEVMRWLVVAPKRVCTDVWPQEVAKWAPGLIVSVIQGTPKQRIKALTTGAHVYVINYDLLPWYVEHAPTHAKQGLILDELTKMKNPSGSRFKALFSIIDTFKVRYGLTGSFTSNGLEDVFGQCKIINQSFLGKHKTHFMQKYFVLINRDFGEWMPCVGAIDRVMRVIKPHTFVLESGEYKDKLPECHIVEIRCDMLDREPYLKMKRDFVLQYAHDAKIIALNAASVSSKLQQLACGWAYDSKRIASDTPGKFTHIKTPVWFSSHKFDRLDELIEENQHANTIIVYNFKEELAELQRRYPQSQTLDDTNSVSRWNSSKIELLLVHPMSAQFGLNLQYGGNIIVFLSLSWSFTNYEQVIGRLHRSGQTKDVWVYILLTNKTIDEKIWSALHNKRGVSDMALEALKDDETTNA